MSENLVKWEEVGDHRQRLMFEEGAELVTVEDDARRGRYSGKIIEKNRAKVRAIVAALAAGVGIIRTSKAFGVSTHTVAAIRDRHPDLIAMEEKMLGRRFARLLDLGAERLEDALMTNSIAPAQIPVLMGIIFDKKALLDGKPTTIVRNESGLSIDAFNRFIEELPRIEALPAPVKEENAA